VKETQSECKGISGVAMTIGVSTDQILWGNILKSCELRLSEIREKRKDKRRPVGG
jgi:hypothetical protein